jgi:hypothetical protein
MSYEISPQDLRNSERAEELAAQVLRRLGYSGSSDLSGV